MKRIIKRMIFLLAFVIAAVIGISVFVGYIVFDKNVFLLAIILYFAALYVIYRTSYVQNRILPRIRGGVLSRKLKNSPKNLTVGKDVKMFHPDRISFGDNCNINDSAVFAPLCVHHGNKYPSEIIIGNRVHIGTQDRIASMNKVVIEDDVLFAAFVHITDHSHEFRDVGTPVSQQSVYSKGPVVVKKGSWLAFGCHILSGVTVGEYSVVAANSVVTRDVPPYSVVAGNPARVVKRYNFETEQWESVKHNKAE